MAPAFPAWVLTCLAGAGVVSGLGKGVTASSIGVLLKACGYRVSCIKIGACSAARRPVQRFSS
jgi:hypothetical protein